LDRDAQFLGQFALEALEHRFPGLAFAAGEFPQPRQVPARRTLRNEQEAFAKN
jgi:hypothetical protein